MSSFWKPAKGHERPDYSLQETELIPVIFAVTRDRLTNLKFTSHLYSLSASDKSSIEGSSVCSLLSRASFRRYSVEAYAQ